MDTDTLVRLLRLENDYYESIYDTIEHFISSMDMDKPLHDQLISAIADVLL